MQFSSKLIILVILCLFSDIFNRKKIKRVKGCTDQRCDLLCSTKIEHGRSCNVGHCFPDGLFCYCQWVQHRETYNCDNVPYN